MANGQGQKKRADLLESLAADMDCQYLSDMRETRHKSKCFSAVNGKNPEDYTLRDWKDTASYITGKECPADTESAVKTWILDCLKNC